MATIVLGGIGAAVGSAIGGPAGARLGFSIGATLGSLIDESQNAPSSSVGKLTDLRFSGSSYGAPIPRVWGKARVGANVIWVAEDANGNHLVEHSSTTSQGGGSGGGGGKVTEYYYSATFAAAVCLGSLVMPNGDIVKRNAQVKRIWLDDQLVYDYADPDSKLSAGTDFVWHDGDESQSPDSYIVAAEGVFSANVCAFRGIAYLVFPDLNLKEYSNRIPNISVEVQTDAVTTGNVISDLCRQAGLLTTEIDVSLCSGSVRGYFVANRESPANAIQALCEFFSIDPVSVDGKIKFVPRGGSSVRTITEIELGAKIGGGAARMRRLRRNRTELPGRIDVQYYDADNAYQQGNQSDVRLSAIVQNTETVAVNLTLTADEAKQGASRILDTRWKETESIWTQVPYKHLDLCAGDPITVTRANGDSMRLRIVKMQVPPVGELRLECVPDGLTVVSQVSTGDTGGGTQDGVRKVVPTTFDVWSGKELRYEDQLQAGFYVAATGGTDWLGGTVYYSSDGGTSYTAAGSVSTRSTFGVTSSVLSASGAVADTFDNTNTVDVNTALSGGSLASVTDAEILAGTNHAVVGSEILGVGTVTLLGTNSYRLSHLRRGERGSTMSGHANGERFVLVSPAVVRIPVASDLIGTTVHVKVVSPGQTLADVTAKTCVISTRTPTDDEQNISDIKDSQFLVLASNTVLNNERVLTPGTGLSGIDAGAGSSYTINLADMPARTLKGNSTGSTGAPTDLTASQAASILLNGLTNGHLLWVNSGNWGTTANLFWDSANSRLGVGTNSPVGAIHIRYPNTSTFFGVNTGASSSSGGAGFTFAHDDGAAMGNGERLGFLIFAGITSGSTLTNGAAISAYTTEAWGVSAAGSKLQLEVAPPGSTTRNTIATIGSNGIALLTTTPSTIALGIDGSAARTIGMERASSGAGSKLVVRGGGSASGSTDQNAGDLELRCGVATGNGSGNVIVQTVKSGQGTGTADRSPAAIATFDGFGLVMAGRLRVPRTTVADAAYTMVNGDAVIEYTSLTAGRTVTLIAAATAGAGYVIVIKDGVGNANTNNITVDANGAETIDGALTQTINTAYGVLRLYCTGSAWRVF